MRLYLQNPNETQIFIDFSFQILDFIILQKS